MDSTSCRGQERRSGENTYHHCPRNSIPTLCHKWVEFVVGSHLAPGTLVFPPSTETNIFRFQFELGRDLLFKCCNLYVRFVCSDTVIGIGVEEEDRKHTWMEDANSVSTTK